MTDKIRNLTTAEINDIVREMRLGFEHTPVQENIIFIHTDKTRKKLEKIKIKESKIQELKKQILYHFYRSIISSGEAVGVNAAQCIGEPTTQLTLNSVTYETEIPVRDARGYMFNVQIGDFVNKYINECVGKKEYYDSTDTTYAELDKDSQYFEILAPSENGEMLWCRIEAVTKHPVVNKDGTNTMLKITTENERQVIVTKAKSLLKVIDGKLVGSLGSNAKIGDYIPINTMKYEHTPMHEFDLKNVFSPKEYLFMSEVEKALFYRNEHCWWKKHNDIDFVLPYSRSDGFLDMVDRNILHKKIKNGSMTSIHFKYGNVYMKHNSRTASQLPEIMPLDYNFGYLIGAYCAEGCVTKTQISIANIDNNYLEPIKQFCEKYNITYKIYKTENKIQKGWTTQDIRIYSKLLTELLVKLCNKISHTKKLSNIIVYSNDECKKGFLDAYIGGDGHINKTDKYITMYSTSKELLKQVQCILNTFEIYSFIRKPKKQISNNRGTTVFQQGYTLNVQNSQCKKLASLLDIKIHYKNVECVKKAGQEMNLIINKFNDNFMPSFNSKTQEYEMLNRKDLFDNAFKNIVFEKIKSIEEVPNTTDYAYDLTVEKTRNFITVDGICELDTFHSAGISAKNVTLGFPRALELFNAVKSPSNASTIMYFIKNNDSPEKLHQYIDHFIETKINDLLINWKVFEPENYKLEYWHKAWFDLNSDFKQLSSDEWVLALYFNIEKMYERNIKLTDISNKLKANYLDIRCIPSPLNLGRLDIIINCSEITISNSQSPSYQKLVEDNKIYKAQLFYMNKIASPVLRGFMCSGIPNITGLYRRRAKPNETFGEYPLKQHVKNRIGDKEEEWIAETDGSALSEIIWKNGIDSWRTMSNDMWEIANLLGIEAARQYIFLEFMNIAKAGGISINPVHFQVLVSKMTFTGSIRAIARFGVETNQYGPISRMTFEELMSNIVSVSTFSELDQLNGISSNIVLGTKINAGTGMVKTENIPLKIVT